MRESNNKRNFSIIFFFIALLAFSKAVYADVFINVLAVNATEKSKEREVVFTLPKELTAEDILDTDGLKLDYDIDKAAYFVSGKVNLGAKETKTFKIRIKDLWEIDQDEIDNIKKQIDIGLDGIKDTDSFETGKIKRQGLLNRLDFIVGEQEKYADNIQKRIDEYRIYSKEIDRIRRDALSISFWKSRIPEEAQNNIVKFIVTVENPSSTKTTKVDRKYYLPKEVKPEHIVDAQGFEVGYDSMKNQCYLHKEDELQPSEIKRYEFRIYNIWSIPQDKIEILKDRARKAYSLLEKTKYRESAVYLISNIKEKLEQIEASQSVEKSINEHISAYRTNSNKFDIASKDVQTLENLLEALRENLERSRLKNVIEKIRALKGLKAVADAIFGTKFFADNTWKIITSIMIFVAVLTAIHFALWGQRSKSLRDEDFADVEKEKEEEKEEEKEK